ncbi:hypothetical protein [Agromyces bauzanensis]
MQAESRVLASVISQVALQRHWYRVRHGFPAVLLFASLACATSLERRRRAR